MEKEEITGISSGVIGSAENYSDNVVLGANRGHGFAAEKANHLNDVFQGKDARIVGGNNLKNGADRLVNGVNIQTKYCKTGSKCISECFEDGVFRYLNSDGSPMLIEVPSDKYEAAVQAMKNRIEKGQVPGISDPSQANNLIKKGAFTYEQVKNIAKFGTIESLTYDATNGIRLAGTAMGISATVTYSMAIWNGEDWNIALEQACYTGLKVGGVSFISSILAAQLGRTGLEQGLRGSTDFVVKQMGAKTSAWLANGLRSGNSIYGAAAMNHVSKVLRGNFVTGAAVTLVLSSADFVQLFEGKISGTQVFKNLTTTATGVAGGTAGYMAGAAAGTSILPGIGTIIGGLIGGFIAGSTMSNTTKKVLDQFLEDDAKAMLSTLESVFGNLAYDYLLTQHEATTIIADLKKKDLPNLLKKMYADTDRTHYAQALIRPLIENIVKLRPKIILPSSDDIFNKTEVLLEKNP
ncbi:MAG: hypothetical protein AAGD25_23005 [Cyanobacteria bacterium P01_F01_bin.150]